MENGSSNGTADFTGSQALISNMTTFLSGLSGLSSDPSAKVRKAVCQSITFIATMQLAILEPYFSSICNFMLKGVLDEDEGVAMEACEFWSALSDDNDAHSVLQSHLCTLIPALITRLQLKEEQVMSERIEEEAHATGEKDVNFKPIHRRCREDQKDRDDDEAELSAKWTLRKQAALVLDNLAVTFTATMVLPFALPAIQAKHYLCGYFSLLICLIGCSLRFTCRG
jgi:transportin-1